MVDELTRELEEFESLVQQLDQMSKETSLKPEQEPEKKELPPYRISPKDVANYRFDTSKLLKPLAVPVDKK